MPDAPRILILGSVSLDHPAEPGDPIRLGGVPTYGGIALARTGLAVRAVARAARADRAAIGAALARGGVGVRLVPSARTTAFRNDYDAAGHRTQRLVARAAPLRWAHAAADVAWATHVHLGPLHGADLADDLVAGVAASGRPVSLDVQGLVRSARLGPVEVVGSPRLAAALSAATVVKAAEEELAAVEGFLGAPLAALVERFGLREVVVTAGARGGTVWVEGRRFPYDAVPVAGRVDPTGAGDVFFAAYLAARLAGGAAVDEAARAAAAVAARHVAGGYVVAEAVGGGAPVG